MLTRAIVVAIIATLAVNGRCGQQPSSQILRHLPSPLQQYCDSRRERGSLNEAPRTAPKATSMP